MRNTSDFFFRNGGVSLYYTVPINSADQAAPVGGATNDAKLIYDANERDMQVRTSSVVLVMSTGSFLAT